MSYREYFQDCIFFHCLDLSKEKKVLALLFSSFDFFQDRIVVLYPILFLKKSAG
jgi:hypothetical protein